LITSAVVAVVVAVIVPVPSIIVPAMIMLKLAVAAGPISLIELLGFIARAYPSRALIGRPSVVSVMPNITIVRGIPVTIHPHIPRSRTVRASPQHAGRRRSPNPDSYRKLPE
jgi:hypothetical protein